MNKFIVLISKNKIVHNLKYSTYLAFGKSYSVCQGFRVRNETYRYANFLGHFLLFCLLLKTDNFWKIKAWALPACVAQALGRVQDCIRKIKNRIFYKTKQKLIVLQNALA